MDTPKRRIELSISEDIIEQLKIISFRQHTTDSQIAEAIFRDFFNTHPNPNPTFPPQYPAAQSDSQQSATPPANPVATPGNPTTASSTYPQPAATLPGED